MSSPSPSPPSRSPHQQRLPQQEEDEALAAAEQEEQEEEDAIEEAAGSEVDDEDEQLNLKWFGIHQALPLPDGDPDEPLDPAEEYLLRVRAEAAACPRVVRVEFDAEAHAAKARARAAAARPSPPAPHAAEPAQQQQQAQGSDGDAGAVGGALPAELQGPGAAGGASGGAGGGGVEAAGGGGKSHKRAAAGGGGGGRQAGYVSRLLALAGGALQAGPEWAHPSPQWVRELAVSFRGLRSWMAQSAPHFTSAEWHRAHRLPHAHDTDGWEHLCFGRPDASRPLGAGKGKRRPPRTVQHDRPHPQADADTALVLPGEESSSIAAAEQHAATTAVAPAGAPPATPAAAPAGSDGVGGGVCAAAHGGAASPSSSSSAPPPPPPPADEEEAGEREEEEEEGQGGEGMERLPVPLLSKVVCMEQLTVGALLERRVARLQASEALGELEAQWLFALAAALEKPVHSGVVAALRALVRRVLALRAGLGSRGDPQLARLNTLAVVAGAYFGQDERLVRVVADLELP